MGNLGVYVSIKKLGFLESDAFLKVYKFVKAR